MHTNPPSTTARGAAAPSALRVLLWDAGPALLGVLVVYPALLLGLAVAMGQESLWPNAPTGPARAGALASASVLVLIFLGSSWLTGPQSQIGRLLIVLLLGAVVAVTHFAAAVALDVGSVSSATALSVLSAALAFLLLSVGWFVRGCGGGRSAQYGSAVLLGVLMISTPSLLRPTLRQFDRTHTVPLSAEDRQTRRAATEYFLRTNPLLASLEAVGYQGWTSNRVLADYETGEEFAEARGGRAGTSTTVSGSKLSRSVRSDSELPAEPPSSRLEPPLPSGEDLPLWARSAPLWAVAGGVFWIAALLVGTLRAWWLSGPAPAR